MDERISCPVCGWRGGSMRCCPQCGWELESKYILGPITPEIKAEYERRLEEARRKWQQRLDQTIERLRQESNVLDTFIERSQGQWSQQELNSFVAELRKQGFYPIDKAQLEALLKERLRVWQQRFTSLPSPLKPSPSVSQSTQPKYTPSVPTSKLWRRILESAQSSDTLTSAPPVPAPTSRVKRFPFAVLLIMFSIASAIVALKFYRNIKQTLNPFLISALKMPSDQFRPDQFRQLHLHLAIPISVSFSPDGQILAVGGMNGIIGLWKVPNYKLIKTLDGGIGIYADVEVCFSPDGQLLASASRSGNISLWRASDGALLRRIRVGPTDTVFKPSFSPNGKLLASLGDSLGTVNLYKVPNLELVLKLKKICAGRVYSASFSPDGRILAITGEYKILKLYRVSDGKLVRASKEHHVFEVSFSPDGSLLASGGDSIKLWRFSDGKLVRILDTSCPKFVYCFAFSPDSQFLASGNCDGTIELWQIKDGKLFQTLTAHEGAVRSVCFSPDGQVLASGGDDGKIRLWNLLPILNYTK